VSLRKIENRFLMALLYITLLVRQRTKKSLRNVLRELPDELNKLYDSIMYRISSLDKDDAELAYKVLQWVAFAKEPLQAIAVQHAVSVTLNSTDIDEDDLIPIEDLVSICIGMITVDPSNIVRLVHYTAQKYLEERLRNGHIDITKVCLTYLGFDTFKEPSKDAESLRKRVSQYALIKYAARYWPEHAHADNEHLWASVVTTFQNQGTRDSFCQIERWNRGSWHPDANPFNKTLLHILAENGSSNVCRVVLGVLPYKNEGHIYTDIDARDNEGQTALVLAAQQGHLEIVKLLIDAGADLEARDKTFERASLCWAAMNGHITVVKILIDARASLNAEDKIWCTPLEWAARNRHANVAANRGKRRC
jgi:hypothetical protein